MTEAFISLKQPDLHAISALASLRQLLDVPPIALFRCRHLSLPMTEQDAKCFLETRFDVVNPNKEQIVWHAVPPVSLTQNQQIYWVDVRPKNPPVGLFVSAISWGIVVGIDVSQSTVLDTIVYSRSSTKGLLANPLLDDVVFL